MSKFVLYTKNWDTSCVPCWAYEKIALSADTPANNTKINTIKMYSVPYEINLVVNLPAKHAQHYTSAQWSTLASRLWIATAKPSPNRPTIIVKQFTENKCSLTVCYRLARSPHQTEPRVYDINIAFIDFRPNFQLCPYHASLLVHSSTFVGRCLCRSSSIVIAGKKSIFNASYFFRNHHHHQLSRRTRRTIAMTLPAACPLRSLSLPVVGKK